MTEQGAAPQGTRPAVADERAKAARGALARYRVMAYVTGVMLLLLCLEMVLHYGPPKSGALDWVPRLHGFVYMVYLVTTWDLWSRMRWSWGRLVTMALAGVVPVMSFVLERRVHAQADARIGS
jgi:integral membrane protein